MNEKKFTIPTDSNTKSDNSNSHILISNFLQEIRNYLPAAVIENETELRNLFIEIEEHILDHAQDLCRDGPLNESAIQDVIRSFGDPLTIAESYCKEDKILCVTESLKKIPKKNIKLERYNGNIASNFIWIIIKMIFLLFPFNISPWINTLYLDTFVFLEIMLLCFILGNENHTLISAKKLQEYLILIRLFTIGLIFYLNWGIVYTLLPVYVYGLLASILYLKRINYDIKKQNSTPNTQLGRFIWSNEFPKSHILLKCNFEKQMRWIILLFINVGLLWIFNIPDTTSMFGWVLFYISLYDIIIWGIQFVFRNKSISIQYFINLLGMIFSFVIVYYVFSYNFLNGTKISNIFIIIIGLIEVYVIFIRIRIFNQNFKVWKISNNIFNSCYQWVKNSIKSIKIPEDK